jgi:hypothetical protein
MLLSRDPLSVQDLDALEAVASRLQFEIVQSPRYSADDTFAAIASGSRLADAIAAHPLNIAAPTDDTPFFFHMLRLRDVFNTARWHDQGIVRFNMTAVGILGVLMVTVTVLTAACIVLPLVVARSRHLAGSKDPALHHHDDVPGCRAGSLDPAGNRATIAPHLLYFGAIGFGFMLVEISQVQRLAIFLGHPVYSLSVVLFSLLLSSGIGSLATSRLSDSSTASTRVLLLLVIVLVAFGSSTPLVVRYFDAVSIAVRIVVAVAILLPIGFFMGMAFPIGMRRALAEAPSIAPWLWGVNGAASVCASVLVVVIALGAGISAAFWVGAAFYLIALFALLTKRSQEG